MKSIFVFDEKDGVEFTVQTIPEKEKREMRQQFRQQKGWKDSDDVDYEGLGKEVFRKSIVDWKGVKNKHLSRLLDVEKHGDGWNYIQPAAKETEVKFDKANLEMLVENASVEFVTFWTYANKMLKELQRKALDESLKN